MGVISYFFLLYSEDRSIGDFLLELRIEFRYSVLLLVFHLLF